MNGRLSGAVAIILLLLAGLTHAAPVKALLEPDTNFEVVMNGVFAVCPGLVLKRMEFPDDASAKPFGWKSPSKAGSVSQLVGIHTQGTVQLRYNDVDNSCAVHFGGEGYKTMAGAVRAAVVQQKPQFRSLLKESKNGLKSEVFVRDDQTGKGLEQFMVIENSKSKTTSVDLRLKAKP